MSILKQGKGADAILVNQDKHGRLFRNHLSGQSSSALPRAHVHFRGRQTKLHQKNGSLKALFSQSSLTNSLHTTPSSSSSHLPSGARHPRVGRGHTHVGGAARPRRQPGGHGGGGAEGDRPGGVTRRERCKIRFQYGTHAASSSSRERAYVYQSEWLTRSEHSFRSRSRERTSIEPVIVHHRGGLVF